MHTERRRVHTSVLCVVWVLVATVVTHTAWAFVPVTPLHTRTLTLTRTKPPCVPLISRQHVGPLALLLDLGDVDEEQSDFYNPEGIKEGDKVRVVKEGIKFFHIPKLGPEGLDPHGTEGEVTQIKITSKNGVVCSATRPVVVKFTEPRKFLGHFEFRELKKL